MWLAHLVMWAVRQDGYALRYADESLQDDRDVVLEAVNNCGAALYYASDTLKKDIDIATTALEREGDGAMPFVDARLRYGSDMKRAATRGRLGRRLLAISRRRRTLIRRLWPVRVTRGLCPVARLI